MISINILMFSVLYPNSNSPDTLTPTFKKIKKNYDRKINDLSRYLAAMPPEKGCSLDSTLLNNKQWKVYSDTANADWLSYHHQRIIPLREWAYDEIGELNSKRFKFFYPFSGPDILHANMFFRNADTTVMFGLEAVGKIPLYKTTNKDSVASYIKIITHSLHAVLNYSFFRTLSMRKDLTSSQVNGTLPLLMILLSRTGNRVLDIKGVHVDEKGMMHHSDLENRGKKKIPGVEITYCQSDSTHESKLYYYAVDISNSGMINKTPEFLKYLKNMGQVYTFIKSASYLMHNETFSIIRNLILEQSRIVLQDDSGIPHTYFKIDSWEYNLYGMYNGCISLFQSRYQSSLSRVYKTESAKVKKLAFGIGYKYTPGESNIVLYRKKSRSL